MSDASSDWHDWKQCGWQVDWYECPVCAAMVQGQHGVEDHAKWHNRADSKTLCQAEGTNQT